MSMRYEYDQREGLIKQIQEQLGPVIYVHQEPL